jgi:hypothetical protein
LIPLKPAASRWVSKYFSEPEEKSFKRNQITAADFSYFERPIKLLHERISKEPSVFWAVSNLAFPKTLRTICYIIHIYQELGVLNI